jgi:hypothetical protein
LAANWSKNWDQLFLTDNGKEFTDRLFGLRKRAESGKHEVDKRCTALDIEHRLVRGFACSGLKRSTGAFPRRPSPPPRSLQTNGMVDGSMVVSKMCCKAITSNQAKSCKPGCIDTSGSKPATSAVSLGQQVSLASDEGLAQNQTRFV